MAIERLLAQMTVSDVALGIAWYTRLFGRAPDLYPMDGLVEWHLTGTFGVQVWREPDRAGRSCMVLGETDLEGRLAALDEVGIPHDGIHEAATARILPLVDPDANRIVFSGP